MNPHTGYPFVRFTLTATLVFLFVIAPIGGIQADASGPKPSDNFLPAPSIREYARLDRSFNGTGFRTDGFGGGRDSIGAAALQPDGKIVVAGSSGRILSGSDVVNDLVVTRYSADGTQDTTFGTSCRLQGSPPFSGYGVSAVAVQADGKIVAAGSSTHANGTGIGNASSMIVIRCNADGSIDRTMGVGLGRFGSARSLVIQPDGKIITAGTSQNLNPPTIHLAVVRFNADGTPDTSFDGEGIALLAGIYGGQAAALQADGKIIVAGDADENFSLARLNADGSLDTTFDGDGRVSTPILTGMDRITSLAVQPDGKIVASGHTFNGTDDDFAVVRYNPDGSLDTSFDTDGKVVTPVLPGKDKARSMVIQPDGRIAVAGGSNNDFSLVRYNTDGSLDTSFDTDGKVTTPFLGNDSAGEILLRPDGRLIAAGTTANEILSDFALAGYNTDGSLDSSFGMDGKVTTDYGTQSAGASSVAIQSDGKIVVVGFAIGANLDFALTRYNPDGSLDPGFGVGGKVVTPILSLNDAVTSVTIQPDGKIVAAGYAVTDSNSNDADFALARYNTDGSLDTTFDRDGKVTTPIRSQDDRANSVVIQPDGKIVAPGYAEIPSGPYDFAVARYNTDGSLDTSFDNDGTVTTLPAPARIRYMRLPFSQTGK